MKCQEKYRVVFFAVLMNLMVFNGHSQHAPVSLPYTQYTVADGLAQMQIRYLFADHDGLVWIGTQGGLSVFDGSVLRTFGDMAPLAEAYIMTMTRGVRQLYISTINGSYAFDGIKITPLGDGKIHPAVHVLFEDAQQTVWFKDNAIPDQTYLYKDGSFKALADVYPTIGHLIIQRVWGNPEWDKCYILDRQNRFYVFNPASGELTVDSLTFSPSDKLLTNWNVSADKSSILFQRRGLYKGDSESVHDLYRLSDGKMEHVATRNPRSGNLQPLSTNAPIGYVGTIDEVSTLFVLRDSVYLPGVVPLFSYIRFMVEANHKMYLGTDNGFVVIHADGLETINYPACDYAWSVVPGPDEEVYIGCYKTGVHRLAGDGTLLNKFALPDIKNGGIPGEQILSNYLITPSAICWGGNTGFLALKKNSLALEHIHARRSVEALAEEPLTGAVLAGSDLVYWYSPDLSHVTDSIALEKNMLGGGFINDLLISNDRHLWVAAPGGIERINLEDRTTALYTSSDTTLPCRGGVTLDTDEEGNLWSGGTCGLMVRRQGTDLFEHVLPGIITQRVNQVSLLPDKKLACASNNNLYLLDISARVPVILAIYNRKNGLSLNEPSENGSCVTGDRYVWLPSVSGIQRLDLRRVPFGFNPAKMMVMRINNKTVKLQTNTIDSLVATGPAALLDLSLIDHSGRTWQFQYTLDQQSYSPWQSATELLVSGLQHGQNNVLIRAAWNPADTSTYTELPLVLHTTLPLMSRHRMQLALLIFTLLLISFVVASILIARRNATKAERLKGDLSRNRLKTIQVYLNPHFLFNTLSSIQDRVLHQDAREGNDMIVRLARVFRKVLDNGKADESKIPMTRLSEEISLIEDIVYLNNKQLNTPVHFSLNIAAELQQVDPLIPPMLIQPFVENAFKHAFRESEEEKAVTLDIQSDRGMLMICIMDNGIGYGSSTKAAEHSSLGIQLAQERMAILNELKVENSIEIEDVNPHGTKVVIHIKQMT